MIDILEDFIQNSLVGAGVDKNTSLGIIARIEDGKDNTLDFNLHTVYLNREDNTAKIFPVLLNDHGKQQVFEVEISSLIRKIKEQWYS